MVSFITAVIAVLMLTAEVSATTTLWRGDDRTPAKIEEAGGFKSKTPPPGSDPDHRAKLIADLKKDGLGTLVTCIVSGGCTDYWISTGWMENNDPAEGGYNGKKFMYKMELDESSIYCYKIPDYKDKMGDAGGASVFGKGAKRKAPGKFPELCMDTATYNSANTNIIYIKQKTSYGKEYTFITYIPLDMIKTSQGGNPPSDPVVFPPAKSEVEVQSYIDIDSNKAEVKVQSSSDMINSKWVFMYGLFTGASLLLVLQHACSTSKQTVNIDYTSLTSESTNEC